MDVNTMDREQYKYPQYPRVRALYNYDYVDEGRTVWMKENEIFYLLEGIDKQDWWHVCRPDDIQQTFYVPSTYVEKVESGNVNTISIDTSSTGHDFNNTHYNDSIHNKGLTHTNSYDGSTGNLGTFGTGRIQMDHQEGQQDYINVSLAGLSSSSLPEDKESFKVQYISPKRQSELRDINEGEYANLEDIRAAADLPPLTLPQQSYTSNPQVNIIF